jgi:methylenetetrahydrofolate reductase (NADPH)
MSTASPARQPFSFELFPPKTDTGMDKLKHTVSRLDALDPLYFSVTYGAGGSTRERTFATVDWLRGQGMDTMPHLSCIGSTREEIADILAHYRRQDIRRLIALRGDMPSGMQETGDFRYASDLVRFIRETSGDHFHIEVAAYPEIHPQAASAEKDLAYLKQKADAGANGAITQYFYNIDAYLYFMDRCAQTGIDIPLVPGIMPIGNFSQLARFSDGCGAEIPRWLRKRMEGYGDDSQSIRGFGIEFVSRMCESLLRQGAPGLHFYTMNQANLVERICDNLG